jgi:hypothetical protein
MRVRHQKGQKNLEIEFRMPVKGIFLPKPANIFFTVLLKNYVEVVVTSLCNEVAINVHGKVLKS